MIPFQKSIGFRLLGISFILLALPLLVDSFILVRERYKHTISEAQTYLIEISNLREIPVSKLPPLNHPLMDLLIHSLGLEKEFPEKQTPELNEQLKRIAQVGGFNGVFLVHIAPNDTYKVIASSLPQYLGRDYTNFFKLNDLYTPISLESGVTTYISFDDKSLHPYLFISHAVYSLKEERFVGLVVVTEDITLKISDLVSPDTRRYPVNFALMLPSTIVFAASDPNLKFQYFLPLKQGYSELFQKEEPFAAQQLPSQPIPVKSTTDFPFFEFTWNGSQQIGYVHKLPGGNYSLLTYASKRDIFKAPLKDFLSTYSVYGAILLIGGLLATLVTKRMAKPIQNLSQVMQKMQEGDLSLRYQKDSLGFEINVLGAIFNEMVDAVLEQKHVAEGERVKRETLARELRLGQQVQRGLLPQQMPTFPGVDVAEIYIPAIEVGGDFYDVFVKEEREEPKLVLAVADASGKGVQACFYSLSIRNMLRTYAREYEDIGQAMSATNDLFRKDTGETGMFVTLLAGIYDHKTKILSYQSSGHNPGYVRRENGTVDTLQYKGGMAMGVLPSKPTAAHTIQLHKGDTVVFYTDGITEAMNGQNQLFGDERLVACLRESGDTSAEELVELIVSRVAVFVDKAPQHDDITLLAMKITE